MSYSNGVKAYYAAELTFYLSSTFMLVLWEERRKDFHVMMLHHLMSVFLIAASYTTKCAALNPAFSVLCWSITLHYESPPPVKHLSCIGVPVTPFQSVLASAVPRTAWSLSLGGHGCSPAPM